VQPTQKKGSLFDNRSEASGAGIAEISDDEITLSNNRVNDI
jgi:hypothetical protein